MRLKQARAYLASSVPFVFVEKIGECDRISCLARNVVVLVRLSGRKCLRVLKSKLEAPSLVSPCLRPTTLPQLWVLRLRLRDPVQDSSAPDFQADLEAESPVLVCACIKPLRTTMFELALLSC